MSNTHLRVLSIVIFNAVELFAFIAYGESAVGSRSIPAHIMKSLSKCDLREQTTLTGQVL